MILIGRRFVVVSALGVLFPGRRDDAQPSGKIALASISLHVRDRIPSLSLPTVTFYLIRSAGHNTLSSSMASSLLVLRLSFSG